VQIFEGKSILEGERSSDLGADFSNIFSAGISRLISPKNVEVNGNFQVAAVLKNNVP
jgi:hypothetical protein